MYRLRLALQRFSKRARGYQLPHGVAMSKVLQGWTPKSEVRPRIPKNQFPETSSHALAREKEAAPSSFARLRADWKSIFFRLEITCCTYDIDAFDGASLHTSWNPNAAYRSAGRKVHQVADLGIYKGSTQQLYLS